MHNNVVSGSESICEIQQSSGPDVSAGILKYWGNSHTQDCLKNTSCSARPSCSTRVIPQPEWIVLLI